jgi:hypothetical protein
MSKLPVELNCYQTALADLKDAWLRRDLDRIGPLWAATIETARQVQQWRLRDSQAQDVRDAKKTTLKARIRNEARRVEQGLIGDPRWPVEFVCVSLQKMKPLLDYVAKMKDAAYAG